MEPLHEICVCECVCVCRSLGLSLAHSSSGSNLRGMCTLRPAAVACVKPRCHDDAPACTAQGRQVRDDELDRFDDASRTQAHMFHASLT